MKRKIFGLILLLFIPLLVKADQPRTRYVFSSPNEEYEFRYISGTFNNQIWSLIEKKNKNIIYQIIGAFLSKTVFISDDGKSVVAVDDYSDSLPEENLDVLFFYRDGKEVKKYNLGQLLEDTENIESTVSHFRWYFHFKPNKPMVFGEGKIKFKTFELVNYSIDIISGEILEKEKDQLLSDDSIYIYGKIKKLNKNKYEMQVCHLVQGKVPEDGKIEFEIDSKTKLFDNTYYTVIIKNGKLVDYNNISFNSCNYQRIKNSNKVDVINK